MPALKKILLTEDEPDIQIIVRFALENVGGYTVELCGSGREAVEKVVAFQPDLIVLDVMMPGMDGPTTLAALREIPEAKNIPVIFMTAKVQPQEIAEYKALGVVEVINKPFDAMTLSTKIQHIWEQHHV